MNALLGYGSSSSSGSDDDSSSEKEASKETTKPKLPKPSIGESALQTSVFSNPFVEAELAKAAILEKHVKMLLTKDSLKFHVYNETRNDLYPIVHIIVKYIGNDCKVPGKDDTQMINGKKICWNYRKGRCRFGHKCKYAHDSDIQKTSDELEAEKKFQCVKSVVCESTGTVLTPQPHEEAETVSHTDDAIWEGGSDKRKLKRPGLSATLVPGKKVLKMYKEQKIRDNKK